LGKKTLFLRKYSFNPFIEIKDLFFGGKRLLRKKGPFFEEKRLLFPERRLYCKKKRSFSGKNAFFVRKKRRKKTLLLYRQKTIFFQRKDSFFSEKRLTLFLISEEKDSIPEKGH
jgi:hypothetical protein